MRDLLVITPTRGLTEWTEKRSAMRDGKVDRKTRTTWQVNVREVAAALGIEVSPNQWVAIENPDAPGGQPMAGRVHVVVWESHDA